MMVEPSKQDWQLFRKRLPGWQEAYMDRLNRKYAEILSGEGSPSDKFWALEKCIREDKKHPGVQLQLSRSNMIYALVVLLNSDAITQEDLEGFSDTLMEQLAMFCRFANQDE